MVFPPWMWTFRTPLCFFVLTHLQKRQYISQNDRLWIFSPNRGENKTKIKVHMFETTTCSRLWCQCSIQAISNLLKTCGFDHLELGDQKHSSHQQAKDGPMTNLWFTTFQKKSKHLYIECTCFNITSASQVPTSFTKHLNQLPLNLLLVESHNISNLSMQKYPK